MYQMHIYKSLNPARHSGSSLYFSPADDLGGGTVQAHKLISVCTTQWDLVSKIKTLGLQVANHLRGHILIKPSVVTLK